MVSCLLKTGCGPTAQSMNDTYSHKAVIPCPGTDASTEGGNEAEGKRASIRF